MTDDLFAALAKAVGDLGDLVKQLNPQFAKLVDSFTAFGKVLTAGFGDVFASFVEQFKVLGTLGTSVAVSLKTVVVAFAGVAKAIAAAVGTAFGGVFGVIGSLAAGVLKPLKDAVVSVGQVLSAAVPEALKQVASAVAQLFPRIGAALSQVGNAIGQIGGAIPVVGAAIALVGAMGQTLGAMAQAAGAAAQAAIALGQALVQFVGLANPGVVALFNNALDDLQAVVGQALIPVLQVVTQITRTFGDTLATFAGTVGSSLAGMIQSFVPILSGLFDFFGRMGQVVGKVMTALQPAVEAVGAAFNEVMKAIEPVEGLVLDVFGTLAIQLSQLLSSTLQALVPVIVEAANAVRGLLQTVADFIRGLFGIEALTRPGEGTKKDASLGAAVKQVSYGTQQSVIQKAQQSAFSLGGAAAAAKPEERTASATEKMVAPLQAINDFLKSLPDLLAKAVGDAVKDALPSAEGVSRAVAGPVEAVGRFAASTWSEAKKIAGIP